MASLRKRGRVWHYRYTDANGVKRESAGCPDRRETEAMARHAETEAHRIRSGELDPKTLRILKESRRPIQEHVDEFIGTMVDKGRNQQHIDQTRTYLERVIRDGKLERIGDLTPSAVLSVIGTLRDVEEFSVRTLNSYITAAKALSKWLWDDGRCGDYALRGLERGDVKSDRRRIRCPLSADELRTLLDVTRQAPEWRGVSGPDRAAMYLVGAVTGLRRTEMQRLARQSFRLDDATPAIIARCGYTKNKHEATQPIPPSLVPALRAWLDRKAPGEPLFGHVPKATCIMLRKDLARAGIKDVNERGEVVDMHSLRYAYITELSKTGAPLKVIQTLARHSDPRLTMGVYARLNLHDVAGAVEGLPDLTTPPRKDEPASAHATGTDGKHISGGFAHHLPTAEDGLSRKLTVTGGLEASTNEMTAKSQPLVGSVLGGRSRIESARVDDGIRTRDIQIHNLAP